MAKQASQTALELFKSFNRPEIGATLSAFAGALGQPEDVVLSALSRILQKQENEQLDVLIWSLGTDLTLDVELSFFILRLKYSKEWLLTILVQNLQGTNSEILPQLAKSLGKLPKDVSALLKPRLQELEQKFLDFESTEGQGQLKSLMDAVSGWPQKLRTPDEYGKADFPYKIMLVGSGYSYLGMKMFEARKANPFYTVDVNRASLTSDVNWPMSMPDCTLDICVPAEGSDFAGKFDVVILERLPIDIIFNKQTLKNCLGFLKSGGKLISGAPQGKIFKGEKDSVEWDRLHSFKIRLKAFNFSEELSLGEIEEQENFEITMPIRRAALDVMTTQYIEPFLRDNELVDQIRPIEVAEIGPNAVIHTSGSYPLLPIYCENILSCNGNFPLWIKKSKHPQLLFVVTKK
jgi:hypothetical protein